MNDRTDSWIDSALDDLAAADARAVVPAQLEAAVLRAWDAQLMPGGATPLRPARAWQKAAAWILLPAAAAVVIAIASFALDPDVTPDRRLSAVRADPIQPSPGSMDPGYVIVPEPFADPATLHVVRVRMARMALASLGMPLAEPDAEGLVDVEILVGDDGVARSIRNATFVREGADRGAGR